jgi:hexokinase
MGLIVGTGCNATIPLALRKLHPSKRSKFVKVADGEEAGLELKIAVNTEWTIRGAADPLHKLDFITKWDSKLDSEGEAPGFQPFEYMTAGRYLGELGRLIIVDYFTNYLQLSKSTLPQKLQSRHGLTTTFLGNVGRHLSSMEPSILKQMEMELPLSSPSDAWIWTEETANIVYAVAKAVQQRAAGMVAAATIGLLACAGEIHLSAQGKGSSRLSTNDSDCTAQLDAVEDLMVGFTGGCIVHFQDYLLDCQGFLDSVMEKEFGDYPRPRIVLLPCHDGGILGAGILAGSVQSAAYDAA